MLTAVNIRASKPDQALLETGRRENLLFELGKEQFGGRLVIKHLTFPLDDGENSGVCFMGFPAK